MDRIEAASREEVIEVRFRPSKGVPDGGVVSYLAAAPAERRATFTGSGLPFASPRQAFERTPNRGVARVGPGGTCHVQLVYPNAYYVGLGTAYVPPVVHVSYSVAGANVTETVPVGRGLPFRTLTYPDKRSTCMFYDNWNLPVRTQEQILRSSAYPEARQSPPNFWGLKPPV